MSLCSPSPVILRALSLTTRWLLLAGMIFVEKEPPILSAGPDIKNALKTAGKACIVRTGEVFGERLLPQLVLCIVPDRSAAESRSVYEAIKKIGLMDLPAPLVTQCPSCCCCCKRWPA